MVLLNSDSKLFGHIFLHVWLKYYISICAEDLVITDSAVPRMIVHNAFCSALTARVLHVFLRPMKLMLNSKSLSLRNVSSESMVIL